MAVLFKLSAIVTTIVMTIAIAPSTAIAVAVAVSSTAPPSGSYTLCQFYSSIPGISSTHETSMTLPLCPSSLLTFSYTIPPTTATPTSTIAPSSSSDTSTSSWTLCQFYSRISGVPSPTTRVSSMTLPSCPASLQDITYSYQQAPLATAGGHVPSSTTATTASPASATSSVTTSTGFVAAAASTSSFTGAAAAAPRPPVRLERIALVGGVGGILAGAVGMML
ncbi:uncharacterized protein Z520_08847 [Fonsecaea multimorphosa CBS 102226]|uniref:Uncharacterized protein n=1 Tax=Fonsecaea multimorphosa CBS 102226 TaxID=1442371 RepID=A0A0D2H0J6_9EURO|nr:uncharacterized protein Z520_08847 [Fonsecaea multimorphosa CBS 102226]KIX95330.1 hypothetical protein Z520_08847 [Fonsecaea multimorphosa CBS 102226]OAL21127.1 hypothetical protein AYO22_08284 [Fonsecaea multimorphosa]